MTRKEALQMMDCGFDQCELLWIWERSDQPILEIMALGYDRSTARKLWNARNNEIAECERWWKQTAHKIGSIVNGVVWGYGKNDPKMKVGTRIMVQGGHQIEIRAPNDEILEAVQKRLYARMIDPAHFEIRPKQKA